MRTVYEGCEEENGKCSGAGEEVQYIKGRVNDEKLKKIKARV